LKKLQAALLAIGDEAKPESLIQHYQDEQDLIIDPQLSEFEKLPCDWVIRLQIDFYFP
jgi:hypothetical protein